MYCVPILTKKENDAICIELFFDCLSLANGNSLHNAMNFLFALYCVLSLSRYKDHSYSLSRRQKPISSFLMSLISVEDANLKTCL